jgi:hypothetical protein
VYGNCHRSAIFDGRYLLSGERVLCILSNIDVARQFCPSTIIDNICANLDISDDGRVLLAGTDSCTVPCDVGVN